MSTRRVIAAVVLVLMVALIVIGVATKDHKLILVTLVVGAVPAFAGNDLGSSLPAAGQADTADRGHPRRAARAR
jgi:hypothetical protein